MSAPLRVLALSLALTLVPEEGLALLLRKRGRTLLYVFLANVLTNPPVVLAAVLWRANGLPCYPGAVAALEMLAAGAEGFAYARCRAGFSHPFRFSLAANALSFGLGLLLQWIL